MQFRGFGQWTVYTPTTALVARVGARYGRFYTPNTGLSFSGNTTFRRKLPIFSRPKDLASTVRRACTEPPSQQMDRARPHDVGGAQRQDPPVRRSRAGRASVGLVALQHLGASCVRSDSFIDVMRAICPSCHTTGVSQKLAPSQRPRLLCCNRPLHISFI